MTDNGQTYLKAADLAKWLIGVTQLIIIGLLSWLLTTAIDLNVRVAKIEANRFTNQDAIQFLEANVPPKEVSQLLQIHTTRIEDLQRQFRDLETRR